MAEHASSSAMAIVELVHWFALGVMALVYILRVRWLLSFRATRDRQAPGRPGVTSAEKGALYSLGNVAMPWVMESTRTKLPFYASFVIFHLGVVAGITLAFGSVVFPGLLKVPVVALIFQVMLASAFLISVGRLIRRMVVPVMRLISTPDDYFALITLTIWFFSGVLAETYIVGTLQSEWYLIAYLAITSFFLVYVPFSKISHYLYYPFTRYWLGRTLGHRGSMPATRG